MKNNFQCRTCSSANLKPFIDLGSSPPSNSYLAENQLNECEIWYPLRVNVCCECWLVQTEDFAKREEFFNDSYAYFSSTSASWVAHAKLYSEQVIEHFNLDKNSMVLEIASNDGYLLKNFVEREIPCLGIEPTKSTAEAARKIGVETITEFFGHDLGKQLYDQGKGADLIAANNVFAHVPDILDFASGINEALNEQGVVTLEFPYVMQLIDKLQFDTVYHEHYSYLSLLATKEVFSRVGLRIFDVEELPTHGGSLRVCGCKKSADHIETERFQLFLKNEIDAGINQYTYYENMMARIQNIKNEAIKFLISEREKNRSVAGYGAAAKGNTFLNYAGIRSDLLSKIYDKATAKQNMYTPGTHIQILSPDLLFQDPPDTLIILPWNIADEIVEDLAELRKAGTSFVRLFPKVEHL